MFLAKDKYEKIAWPMTADKGQIDVLRKLWEWGREAQTQEELNSSILARDGCDWTARHMAVKKGQIELLPNLWELC